MICGYRSDAVDVESRFIWAGEIYCCVYREAKQREINGLKLKIKYSICLECHAYFGCTVETDIACIMAVSYTHLTLPTNREV